MGLSLTERQRRFCEHYSAIPNATQAAILAGYSERTARSIGAELLTKPDIVDYIKSLSAEADAERIAKAEEVKEYWTSVLRDDEQRTEIRMRAGELLLKAGGEFTQKIEVDADVHETEDVIFYIPENHRNIIKKGENDD